MALCENVQIWNAPANNLQLAALEDNGNTTTTNTNQQSSNYQQKETSTKKNIKESNDPEATCYIREITEHYKNVNFINSQNFEQVKLAKIIEPNRRAFWIRTKIG